MGLSISHSDNSNQMQMIRQRKKLKLKQKVAQEVQQSASKMPQGSALKENNNQSSPVNANSNRLLPKNSKPVTTQSNNIASMGSKKQRISSSKNGQQPEIYVSKPSKNIGNRQSRQQQQYGGQVKNDNDKALRSSVMSSGNKAQQRVNQKPQIRKQSEQRKQKSESKILRESATLEVKRSENKQWKGTGKQIQQEAENMNLQLNRLSFNQFDWSIPGQEEKEMFKKKAIMPSMNLVLSNKFAENIGNLNEEQDQQLAARNRRQVMRELLSGKRNTADDGLLPNCNFKKLEVSQFCQQK